MGRRTCLRATSASGWAGKLRALTPGFLCPAERSTNLQPPPRKRIAGRARLSFSAGLRRGRSRQTGAPPLQPQGPSLQGTGCILTQHPLLPASGTATGRAGISGSPTAPGLSCSSGGGPRPHSRPRLRPRRPQGLSTRRRPLTSQQLQRRFRTVSQPAPGTGQPPATPPITDPSGRAGVAPPPPPSRPPIRAFCG